ncbi:M23 family metallopeptidase [Henriciella marina]|uniref:M23 family metallopeptidase n=1 Tax=Henriciella marina TaxID=453851 RepID=UPI00036F1740|nr:M23 family metallopeptidase [Henriciella marina]
MTPIRLSIAFAVAAFGGLTAASQGTALSCTGVMQQGGLLSCSGPAETEIRVAGENGANVRDVRTDADGNAVIGLTRDETSLLILTPGQPDAAPLALDITARNDDIRVLSGLDCDKVDARTEEQMRQVEVSWLKKKAAFETFNEGPGASLGFKRPAEGRASSPFGPERKYSGTGADGETCEKVSVHQGYDIAAPIGTPVRAPAPGTVILGDPDLYYEGGAVFLDHGQGLVSVFMHMSKVGVTAGDEVEAGEQLGLTGNTGRTTGPHLHWAVKWRNPASENRDEDFYIDPALLMALEPQ